MQNHQQTTIPYSPHNIINKSSQLVVNKMNNQRKQAAKNFLRMLLEQDIPLRDGHEEDKIVLCLGLLMMLELNQETRELVDKMVKKQEEENNFHNFYM